MDRNIDWEPFIESLHEAAGLWDRGLAWCAEPPDLGTAEEELGDQAPRRVVPITAAEAEHLMTAVAFLARRLSVAAESVVYTTAESRLEQDDGDPDEQADVLSLTALQAQAMRHAADLASEVYRRCA
ncbi:hypothetical protein FHS29_005892 [Saccharothrix tamanrassetensis]|uniref:Uncharacterized protein n=1 Tax=Saccharothrix tamanrassetensis TaxID=1051531 RepID=A0A841CLA2_9PSEU|nr:hypothetical protein [Saccharothrix tamanrassetensis]MBB5959272.1 hypothetical protein [Saccharothrix tamanrassetensis]